MASGMQLSALRVEWCASGPDGSGPFALAISYREASQPEIVPIQAEAVRDGTAWLQAPKVLAAIRKLKQRAESPLAPSAEVRSSAEKLPSSGGDSKASPVAWA
jgi:hypothetical protein